MNRDTTSSAKHRGGTDLIPPSSSADFRRKLPEKEKKIADEMEKTLKVLEKELDGVHERVKSSASMLETFRIKCAMERGGLLDDFENSGDQDSLLSKLDFLNQEVLALSSDVSNVKKMSECVKVVDKMAGDSAIDEENAEVLYDLCDDVIGSESIEKMNSAIAKLEKGMSNAITFSGTVDKKSENYIKSLEKSLRSADAININVNVEKMDVPQVEATSPNLGKEPQEANANKKADITVKDTKDYSADNALINETLDHVRAVKAATAKKKEEEKKDIKATSSGLDFDLVNLDSIEATQEVAKNDSEPAKEFLSATLVEVAKDRMVELNKQLEEISGDPRIIGNVYKKLVDIDRALDAAPTVDILTDIRNITEEINSIQAEARNEETAEVAEKPAKKGFLSRFIDRFRKKGKPENENTPEENTPAENEVGGPPGGNEKKYFTKENFKLVGTITKKIAETVVYIPIRTYGFKLVADAAGLAVHKIVSDGLKLGDWAGWGDMANSSMAQRDIPKELDAIRDEFKKESNDDRQAIDDKIAKIKEIGKNSKFLKTPEEKKLFRETMTSLVEDYEAAEGEHKQEVEQKMEQAMSLLIRDTYTKEKKLKDIIDAAFALFGLQAIRLGVLAGTKLVDRAVNRALPEYELTVPESERSGWKKTKFIAEHVTIKALKETLNALSLQIWNKNVSAEDKGGYLARGMGAVGAAGDVLVAGLLANMAVSEISHEGISGAVRHQFDALRSQGAGSFFAGNAEKNLKHFTDAFHFGGGAGAVPKTGDHAPAVPAGAGAAKGAIEAPHGAPPLPATESAVDNGGHGTNTAENAAPGNASAAEVGADAGGAEKATSEGLNIVKKGDSFTSIIARQLEAKEGNSDKAGTIVANFLKKNPQFNEWIKFKDGVEQTVTLNDDGSIDVDTATMEPIMKEAVEIEAPPGAPPPPLPVEQEVPVVTLAAANAGETTPPVASVPESQTPAQTEAPVQPVKSEAPIAPTKEFKDGDTTIREKSINTHGLQTSDVAKLNNDQLNGAYVKEDFFGKVNTDPHKTMIFNFLRKAYTLEHTGHPNEALDSLKQAAKLVGKEGVKIQDMFSDKALDALQHPQATDVPQSSGVGIEAHPVVAPQPAEQAPATPAHTEAPVAPPTKTEVPPVAAPVSPQPAEASTAPQPVSDKEGSVIKTSYSKGGLNPNEYHPLSQPGETSTSAAADAREGLINKVVPTGVGAETHNTGSQPVEASAPAKDAREGLINNATSNKGPGNGSLPETSTAAKDARTGLVNNIAPESAVKDTSAEQPTEAPKPPVEHPKTEAAQLAEQQSFDKGAEELYKDMVNNQSKQIEYLNNNFQKDLDVQSLIAKILRPGSLDLARGNAVKKFLRLVCELQVAHNKGDSTGMHEAAQNAMKFFNGKVQPGELFTPDQIKAYNVVALSK